MGNDGDLDYIAINTLPSLIVSGDGTMRKNPDIWKRWNSNGGHCQHMFVNSELICWLYAGALNIRQPDVSAPSHLTSSHLALSHLA